MRGHRSKKKREPTPKKEEEEQRVKYVNEDNISPHFYCPICSSVFSDPVFIQCGHVYCRPCIEVWLTAKPQCPECRSNCRKANIKPCFLARQLIGDLQVQCINSGCGHTCKLTILNIHMKECKFNPQKLPKWLVDNFKNWDGKDNESKSGIQKSLPMVYQMCVDKINNGELPDQETVGMLSNLGYFQEDLMKSQENRRREDQAFLATFATNQSEEVKRRIDSDVERSPLLSPISSRKFLRRSSTSPSSQPMDSFNNIFNEMMELDDPQKENKKKPKAKPKPVSLFQEQDDDMLYAMELSKTLNGDDAHENFMTRHGPTKSNEAVMRPRKKING